MSSARAGARPTRRRAKAAARARAAKRTARTPARAGTRRDARLAARARRSRVLLAAAAVVAALVLATSFPFSSLLGQRQQLSVAQGQVDRLTSENRALSSEVLRLGDPATVAAIARADYGFVQPGQKAYDILPTAGAPLTSGADSGHVPLEGPPVSPGSAQSQTLLDAGAGATAGGSAVGGAPAGSADPGSHAKGANGRAPSSGTGLWGRVLRTLEFWR